MPACFDRSRTSNRPIESINGRLEHLRGSALGFHNLTNHIARGLLETGGFGPWAWIVKSRPSPAQPTVRIVGRVVAVVIAQLGVYLIVIAVPTQEVGHRAIGAVLVSAVVLPGELRQNAVLDDDVISRA